ncbi:MAG: ABC transporter substrate-binding protein [Rhodobacteraceae bacterium]|nr:ABC transporter substrate-binding protein [Paracoccaceae bacterium]
MTALMLSVPAGAEDAALKIGINTFPQARGNSFVGVSMPATLPWAAIFDTLTKLDDSGRADLALAVDWKNEDEFTWVFKLREGVTFQNGEPFTADAVVNAIKYLNSRDGRLRTLAGVLHMVTKAEARDDFTVVLTTNAPTPLLPLHLRQLRIPAPKAWQELGPDKFAERPIGSGPYAVEKWADAEIDLVAFPDAWRKAKAGAVTIRQIPDVAARVAALQSGAIDLAMFLTVEDEPSVARAGGQLVARREPSLWYTTFIPTQDTPLKDPRVRVAMNLAVDRQRIVDTLMAGATQPATQFALPSSFGYDPELTGFPYDPERAKFLLADAGYYKGFSLVITLMQGTGSDDVYQLIAADLAAVGIRAELRSVPLTQYVKYMRDGTWPGPAYQNGQSLIDPIETVNRTWCGRRGSWHCPRRIKDLTDEARGMFDIGRRAELAREMYAFQLLDPPGLLLWQGVAFDGVGPRVTGYRVVEDVIQFDELGLK